MILANVILLVQTTTCIPVLPSLSSVGVLIWHVQDAWDGYTANRARILNHITKNGIDNTIVLSGDSHANWVSDIACTCCRNECPPMLTLAFPHRS